MMPDGRVVERVGEACERPVTTFDPISMRIGRRLVFRVCGRRYTRRLGCVELLTEYEKHEEAQQQDVAEHGQCVEQQSDQNAHTWWAG
jgi:hypothetical protein